MWSIGEFTVIGPESCTEIWVLLPLLCPPGHLLEPRSPYYYLSSCIGGTGGELLDLYRCHMAAFTNPLDSGDLLCSGFLLTTPSGPAVKES